MPADVVYWIGFAVALAFIVFGADDLLWDVFALFRRVGRKKVPLARINEKPPKMLAVVIAAWHEDAVIGEVIDNLVASAQYPRELYRVFLGVYPNDGATLAVARALEARHGGTVAVAVNSRPGPTSKADNINHTLSLIRGYERDHDVRFASVTIHDAEDVVHPNEFKMTSYFIDDYDALQFPVFPLIRMPRLRLFLKTLTTSTYADEFAEHHFRTMVMRDELGFVPSAGTGFAVGRRVLDAFGEGELLPEDSLTEDYRLSLTLRMRGFRVHYVLERVPRVDAQGRAVWDYIATRSLFPSAFRAAVRQKARWVYGITMQSASLGDVFGKSALTFAERTFLYKDLKAKFANFVLLPGYAVFAYFLVQTLAPQLDLPVMFPLFSPSWWMCVLLLFMMVERQVLRARALVSVYGWRSMAFSVLLPPLFPLRLLWGNLINLCATFRAWRQKAAFTLARNRERRAAAGAQGSSASADRNGGARRRAGGGKGGRAAGVPQERAGAPGSAGTADRAAQEAGMRIAAEVGGGAPAGVAEGAADGGTAAPAASRPAWSKTDHEFLPEPVLARYRRLLGDTLLERDAVTPAELERALARARRDGVPLGRALLAEGSVERRSLAQALALQQQTLFVEARGNLVRPDLLRRLPPGTAARFGLLPLAASPKGWIVLVDDDAAAAARAELPALLGAPAFLLYGSAADLGAALSSASAALARGSLETAPQLAAAEALLGSPHVALGQAGIALGYALHLGQPLEAVARGMGIAVSRGRAPDGEQADAPAASAGAPS